MPKILMNVTEEQKQLWVEAANAQLLTLSEWIRQSCDARLGIPPETGGRSAPVPPLDTEPLASQARLSRVVQAGTDKQKRAACTRRTPSGTFCKECGQVHK